MMQQVGYSDTPQYQTTTTPSAVIVRPVAVPQSTPESTEGLLVPRSPPTDQARSYPDTMLPVVRLIAADNGRTRCRLRLERQLLPIPLRQPPPLPAIGTSRFRQRFAVWNRKCRHRANNPARTDEARLRLLYLAAGRRDEATSPLPGTTPEAHEFWNQEAAGLAALIDDQRIPDSQHRGGSFATSVCGGLGTGSKRSAGA